MYYEIKIKSVTSETLIINIFKFDRVQRKIIIKTNLLMMSTVKEKKSEYLNNRYKYQFQSRIIF